MCKVQDQNWSGDKPLGEKHDLAAESQRNETAGMKTQHVENEEVEDSGRQVRREGGRFEENLLNLDTNTLQQNLKQWPHARLWLIQKPAVVLYLGSRHLH